MLQQLQWNLRQKLRQNLRQKLGQKLQAAGKLLMWPVTVLEKLSEELRKKNWTQKVQLPHLALSAASVAFLPLPATQF